jgi:hypothetical protein
MAKKETIHNDIFGKRVDVGDFVAAPYWNSRLEIFSVIKITPKMLRLRRIGAKIEKTAYPVDVVKVEGADVTMYCLKNSGG